MTRDARVRLNVFSARALARRKLAASPLTSGNNYSSINLDKPKETAVEAKRLKDFAMLVRRALGNAPRVPSSKRAGRVEQEALAYFWCASMGIVHDNVDDFDVAIDVYKKALALLENSDNLSFRALVMSCIGVDYQAAEAAKHHQEALRVAIRLNSAYGQSLAVGNLGLLASRQGDLPTATACMDQHLQLIQSVQDRSAEVNAWMQLGFLATRDGAHDKAVRYFDQAYRLAQDLNEIGIMKQASCYLGIARGCLHAPTFFRNVMQTMSQVHSGI
ncbi:hypothetical protein DYB32_002964 [Aphanomyces invadans]|uniref:Tetratricopeptide repeat protein 29 n=1 Tax=Aphanomyces invadans TaxID=157072 RepID=A0A418B1T5_9STRA|nr:hypothetical protein DYB32_002964 [Aphanomyces invadans]